MVGRPALYAAAAAAAILTYPLLARAGRLARLKPSLSGSQAFLLLPLPSPPPPASLAGDRAEARHRAFRRLQTRPGRGVETPRFMVCHEREYPEGSFGSCASAAARYQCLAGPEGHANPGPGPGTRRSLPSRNAMSQPYSSGVIDLPGPAEELSLSTRHLPIKATPSLLTRIWVPSYWLCGSIPTYLPTYPPRGQTNQVP